MKIFISYDKQAEKPSPAVILSGVPPPLPSPQVWGEGGCVSRRMRVRIPALSSFHKTRSKVHNPHLSAVLTPSPFIKVEGK
jgi:hypothetical protein